MEASTAIGSMRFALTIASTYKGPRLEVYFQVYDRRINRGERSGGNSGDTYKNWHDEFFVQFSIINIGGKSASNIRIEVDGELKPHTLYMWDPTSDEHEALEKMPFNCELGVNQMPPGQVYYLLKIEREDLQIVPSEVLGKFRDEELRIVLKYDPPKGSFLGWFQKLWRVKLLNHTHTLESQYTFKPSYISDAAPTEYLG